MNLTFVFITIILISSLLNYFIENKKFKKKLLFDENEVIKLKEENRDKTIELYFLRKIFELKSNPELKYISVDLHKYLPTTCLDRLLKDEQNITLTYQDLGSIHGSAVNNPCHNNHYYLVKGKFRFESKPDRVYDKGPGLNSQVYV